MTRAGSIALLGVISSIIQIVEGTKNVYDAASNAEGLPEAFREVANRLPIVKHILESAKQYIGTEDVDEDFLKGVGQVVDACEKKTHKLDTLFKRVMPAEGASRTERYFSAIKHLGKGSRVEILMKGILEDIQLLASNHHMNIVTEIQRQEITRAIMEVSAIAPSAPEQLFQDTTFTNNNYGLGPQTNYNAGEDQYNHCGSGKMYNAQSMSFGSDAQIAETRVNITTLNVESMPAMLGNSMNMLCMSALFLTNSLDDRKELIQAKGPRVDGTCTWIKDNELYGSWLQSSSQLLWLSGGPGKGKTMLSIFLAEELEQIVKMSKDKLFLQYFCDNKHEKRNTAVAIMRGLVFQLLQLRPQLFGHILPSFQIQGQSLFTASSFNTLWRIFEAMIRDPITGTTYCVLDGLDECDPGSSEILLNEFKALFLAKSDQPLPCLFNLIIISREFPEFISEVLSGFPRIRLDPDQDSEVNTDIDRFIKARVDELSKYGDYPEPLSLHVEKVFRSRAQGTFLWVGIVAKMLKKYKATEIENALDLFPPGLDELYARMLLQIEVSQREIAAKILLWVVMAVRPLSLLELSAAIETPARHSTITFTPEEVMKNQLEYCGYFLTIKGAEDPQSAKVNLIHQSAKDYLVGKSENTNPELDLFHIEEETGNSTIARRCLEYLESGALLKFFEKAQLDEKYLKVSKRTELSGKLDDWYLENAPRKGFPLLLYAILHWHEHAKSLASTNGIYDSARPFYSKTLIRESWLKVYWTLKESDKPPRWPTILHLASYLGLLPLAEKVLKINKLKRLVYLNIKDNRGKTALMWAAEKGHSNVVHLLIKKGANFTAKNSREALRCAARNRRQNTTLLLLDMGARFAANGALGRSIMASAARFGNEDVAQVLLERGVDIESYDNQYTATALTLAARNGHEAIVRLLLDKGADIETKGFLGWTALIMAFGRGEEAIVRLLIEKGANIQAKGPTGSTTLMLAIERNSADIVRLLLKKGANIEAQNCDGSTALITAVWKGDVEVVSLLLEKGANTEVKDFDGMTALMWVATLNRKKLVQLLLDKKANLEAQDSNGKTALMHATDNGNAALARLLLEGGADAKTKDNQGRTARMMTTDWNEDIGRLLLEKEKEIES